MRLREPHRNFERFSAELATETNRLGITYRDSSEYSLGIPWGQRMKNRLVVRVKLSS
jgi:hypothetical protein